MNNIEAYISFVTKKKTFKIEDIIENNDIGNEYKLADDGNYYQKNSVPKYRTTLLNGNSIDIYKNVLDGMYNSAIVELRTVLYESGIKAKFILRPLIDKLKNLDLAYKTLKNQHTLTDFKNLQVIFNHTVSKQSKDDYIVQISPSLDAENETIKAFLKIYDDTLRELDIDSKQESQSMETTYEDDTSLNTETDRIDLDLEPLEIRNFFSFLTQPTSRGTIMSEEDLNYFLNKNFAGFPVNISERTISFSVLKNVDISFIIFKFYEKFDPRKKYKPLRWAQLLHESFPSKFTGQVAVTKSNLKQNTSTINKLNSFDIVHPL